MSESEGNSFNENDEDHTVNFVEYVNGQNAEIEQANLILEASDGDSCTYSMGYITRQALYACLTCTEEGKVSGAICLPCMFRCHDNHNLIELWTKRNYRCDCGSDKFTSSCQLEPIKPDGNDLNVYNQNFKGLYCTCKRPYPDEENTDEMIQCIVCEDWYHSKHLGTKDMDPDDYSEMICSDCTFKLSFLPAYKHLIVADDSVQTVEKGDETENVNVENLEEVSTDETEKVENNVVSKEVEVVVKKLDNTYEKASTSSNNEICKMNNATDLKKIIGSTFWVEGWRKELCTCSSCIELYKTEGVPFITDQKDTMQAYEDISRKKMKAKEEQSEEGLSRALLSMDRVAAVELAHRYNQFKEELVDWMKELNEKGKVVKPEDVEEFFSGINARKRARMDDGVPPSFCR